MNSKADNKYSTLVAFFKNETGWNKARVKFFVSLICALCKVQSVSFVKLSQGIDGQANQDSNLRRIQRFFSEFNIDNDLIAKIIFALLPEKPPYSLSMDITNWKFGKTDINILVISVCYQGVGIPFLWKMLPKRGNSNYEERIQILNKYIQLFGKQSINGIMADREFIGHKWFEELIFERIPFYIRIKENLWINIPQKGAIKAFRLFNHLKVNQAYQYPKIVCLAGQWIYLTGMKIFDKETGKVEFLIIASYKNDHDVLAHYKERWQIETMFRAMKTSGFNIEVTHLSDLERISKLISVISVAFIWAYKVGVNKHRTIKPIKIKKHGRKQYSFFKYGLLEIAHSLFKSIDYKLFNNCAQILSCT